MTCFTASRAARKVLPLFFLLLAVRSLPAAAATATVQWNSNVETDLAGYALVYGTQPGQYTATVDVGNHTSYQVSNLDPARTYYFAVIAYNTAGMKSAPSAEVSVTTLAPPPVALTSFTATLPSPVLQGSSVTFAALASGGSGSYQYKWMVTNGSATSVAQNWSINNTLAWQPSLAGLYGISVWTRNSTSTIDAADNANAAQTLTFTVTAPVVTSAAPPVTTTPVTPPTVTTTPAHTPAPAPAPRINCHGRGKKSCR